MGYLIARTSLPLLLICSWFLVAALGQSTSRYTVTGNLHDQSGRPAPGFTVCALPAAGGVLNVRDKACAETDAQGKFVIGLAQAGIYQVMSENPELGYMPAYIPFYGDPRSIVTEVVVGDNTPNGSVSLTLGPKGGLVTGKLIDEAADTPIKDFVVWLWDGRDPKIRYRQVVTGGNRFRLVAPTRGFRMRVTAEGYEDWIMLGGVLITAAGPKKGPSSMIVPTASTPDFAVYMKRKEPLPTDPTRMDEKRLPAPIQIGPADNAVLNANPRMTRLEWAPVTGAVSYGVEVEACWTRYRYQQAGLPDDGECINPSPHFEKFGLADKTVEFMFRGAQPGRWRVWAIDDNHRQGTKSPWRRFLHLQ
jgi:hypothetical protein